MRKLVFSLFILALLLGCRNKAESQDSAAAKDSTPADSGRKSLTIDMSAIDKMVSKSPDSVTVATIQTKYGNIEIELYTKDAPKTTANFIGLALAGYYNNIIFHRIAKGYVLQGGDPTGTGAGGTSIYGDTFEDELNPNSASYKEGYQKGVVAMANRGPNTNSSQFFIMLGNAPELPKAYTIFGKVTKGMDVVNKIASQKITPQRSPDDGRPVDPVAMQKVTIEKRGKKLQSIFDTK